DDRNGDGIRGRANTGWDVTTDRPMLGRFGWKAGEPTIRQQVAHAFAGDIGLSSAIAPLSSGDCTANQKACLDAPDGADPVEH
ncbi:di-heme oxidoredictase family protein, partial [Shewanella algae]|uniref:di-heme oxidoredictase family protein n=1 Tax=Shewanella algae TaxID=38313 RepID=UPI00313CD461